jgi:hypothetical protein
VSIKGGARSGRTTFIKHVAKGSTTKDDISLDDERKPVPANHPNPIVLAWSGRHEKRVSDVIDWSQYTGTAEETYHSL